MRAVWSKWHRRTVRDHICITPEMLDGAHIWGLTASASSPEWLVEEIIDAFKCGGAKVELLSVATERIHFPLPLSDGGRLSATEV